LLRGLYGVRYCDDFGFDAGCDCEHDSMPEYIEEAMPETAEPTVAMMTSECDCPNCRADKTISAIYPQEVPRASVGSRPSSRTVSYRDAVPSNQRIR
jgi:hypothetical protein